MMSDDRNIMWYRTLASLHVFVIIISIRKVKKGTLTPTRFTQFQNKCRYFRLWWSMDLVCMNFSVFNWNNLNKESLSELFLIKARFL